MADLIWRPANEPPDVPKHETRTVIVAQKSKAGDWSVFGAWYLNCFDLATEYDSLYGCFDPCTGFYQHSFHDECDEWYEPIDVDFWAPMPEPPKVV